MFLFQSGLGFSFAHVVVFPAGAAGYHHDRYRYHYHHLRELVGWDEPQVVFLAFLHLLVYLLFYLFAFARLHC